jgi:hypothetical protein
MLSALDCSDLLATVYQEILPSPLRHLLGEYYTPSWLVDYCVSHAEKRRSQSRPGITIMDPAVGSGSFLAHYIIQLASLRSPLTIKIVGFDVNPLAIDFCYANAMLAISKSSANSSLASFQLCIHLSDSVVDPISQTDGPLFRETIRREKNVLGVTFVDGGNRPDFLGGVEAKLGTATKTVADLFGEQFCMRPKSFRSANEAGIGPHFRNSAKSVAGCSSNARAIFRRLSSPTFRSPRSTPPT